MSAWDAIVAVGLGFLAFGLAVLFGLGVALAVAGGLLIAFGVAGALRACPDDGEAS